MYAPEVSRLVRAPRSAVYQALLDAEAVARWRMPVGMTSQVHEFDAREGGDERVVEVFEFETDDPALRGEMTMTTTLTDAAGGTEVRVVHDGIPDSVPAADNETGTRMALANLARLVEG